MALFAQRRLHTVCTPRRPSCGSMRRCRNAPATWACVVALLVLGVHWPQPMLAAVLKAGAAKVDITRREAGPVDGPLHARALVIESEHTRVALVALDVVAIGEIGYLDNEFLPALRRRVEEQLSIPARNLLVNASHCHGVPCADVEERTFQAIKAAAERLERVRVGAGSGYEDRVSENRRFKLKDGRVVDSRHAYSLPPDEEVAEVGPIDPQIGVLRLDRQDGSTLAVVYNFACHPIQGVPGGVNTADLTGFASQVIEDNLSPGAVALFIQGCGGDINPAGYKDVHHPRDAEPLGNMLGLSTLKAVREIRCREDGRLVLLNEMLTLPRNDPAERITALETERERLLAALKGTSLNLKTFLSLIVKYNLDRDFPSGYSHRYLHEKLLNREELRSLDAENLRHLRDYVHNVYIMEELTRLQTNLALLRKHQASLIASGKRTVDVEVAALRVGDFVLVTFPGELTVRIGLGIKERSPHPHTFVAGYTNGYIYYAPSADQLLNSGAAQEDCDCILAPAWQKLFEDKVTELLERL